MKTRLQQFLRAENIPPSRFADQIGIQRSGVSHILAGRNKPGFDFIKKMLLTYPSLNAEWLITGKGKMYREVTENTPQLLPAATFDPLPEEEVDEVEEHKLVKVLLFYSDNTFTEHIPDNAM